MRPRRGVALVFVLIFVTAMAALAMSAIFMASNSNLLAKSYDREHDLKFAAEQALEMGKSRINYDPLFLTFGPGTLYKKVPGLDSVPVLGADSSRMPGVYVRVYAGPSGSTSGEYGRFASIVAEARDQRGNGFIRRLELTQESFAKFAYWSNDESNGSTTIFFNNGDELFGPVWSNDTIHIGSGTAKFHEEVGTAKVVAGANYGTFVKGKKENQALIPLPPNALLARLQTYASMGGMAFTSQQSPSSNSGLVRDRIEFIAIDLGGASSDSTDPNEGFFRRYTASTGNDAILRGDFPGQNTSSNPPNENQVNFCGDWHYMVPHNSATVTPGTTGSDSSIKFYPVSVHATTWFRAQMESLYTAQPLRRPAGYANAHAAAVADSAMDLPTIMNRPGARCYLSGDPHLVAVDRKMAPVAGGAPVRDVQRGGDDTTFTAVGRYGSWNLYPGTPPAAVVARRVDASYLFPLDHSFNANTKGVIYESGNIGVSGVLNGHITLYAKGDIILLDDLRYSNDPAKNQPCAQHDILGLLSDKDILIADNALNTPIFVDLAGSGHSVTKVYKNADDSKDFYLHGVVMAMGTSFGAENYTQGPTDTNDCDVVSNGRGCIYLSGGIIQDSRGPVGLSDGHGFSKRYSYDQCVIVNPPPYFPTTGRFMDNRYLELDPMNFNPQQYFQSITQAP